VKWGILEKRRWDGLSSMAYKRNNSLLSTFIHEEIIVFETTLSLLVPKYIWTNKNSHINSSNLLNPLTYKVLSRIDDVHKIFMKYHFEEYFGSDTQIKAMDFWILDSICMGRFTNAVTIFSLQILKGKFQKNSKFDYKQNVIIFWIKFLGMDLKWGSLYKVIFLKFLCYLNLGAHFCKSNFELESMQFWLTHL